MEKKPSRQVPADKAASHEEIVAAIQSLTEAELLRLEKFVRFRIRGLGPASAGRDWRDLLGEALAATLDQRRWNKSVTFVQHLLGAIRSISSSWKKSFDPDEARLESDLMRIDAEGNEHSIFAGIQSTDPDAERIIAAKQEVEDIERIFRDDRIALDVIGGWRSGMTGPDIKEALGISQREYETIAKRIRWNCRNRH